MRFMGHLTDFTAVVDFNRDGFASRTAASPSDFNPQTATAGSYLRLDKKLQVRPRRLPASPTRPAKQAQRPPFLGRQLQPAKIVRTKLLHTGPHRSNARAAERLINSPQRIGRRLGAKNEQTRRLDSQRDSGWSVELLDRVTDDQELAFASRVLRRSQTQHCCSASRLHCQPFGDTPTS
jgi:hypothetical protein